MGEVCVEHSRVVINLNKDDDTYAMLKEAEKILAREIIRYEYNNHLNNDR